MFPAITLMAQLVARKTSNLEVAGSIPAEGACHSYNVFIDIFMT